MNISLQFLTFSLQCSEYITFFCLDYCYAFLGCCSFLGTAGFSLDLSSIPFGSLPWSTLGWINLPLCIYPSCCYVFLSTVITFASFSFNFIRFVFVFLRLHWVSIAVDFLQLQWAGAVLCCSVWASRCCGFSRGAQAPDMQASVTVAHKLSCPWRLRSSWTRPQTHVCYTGRQIFIHWTTREVWLFYFSKGRNFMLPSAWYIGIQWNIDSK